MTINNEFMTRKGLETKELQIVLFEYLYLKLWPLLTVQVSVDTRHQDVRENDTFMSNTLGYSKCSKVCIDKNFMAHHFFVDMDSARC